MTQKQREARAAALAEYLAELNPEYVLRREMVAARKRAGLTQRELARRMRTSQAAVARLETGGRSPSVKTLRRIASATGSRLVVRLEGPAQAPCES